MIELFSQVGFVLGFIVSLVLIIFSIKHRTSNWLLGSSMVMLWYCLIIAELYRTELIAQYPHFSRTGNIVAFLVSPFLFFFTLKLFNRGKAWFKTYWWAFLPVVFYIIDYMPYFVLPLEEKRQVVSNQQLKTGHFVFSEGFLSPDWLQYYLRFFWEVLFLILTLKVLRKNQVLLKTKESKNNRTIVWFILSLTSLYAIAIVPGFFMNYFVEQSYTLELQSITVALALIFTAIFMIFNPAYLYGFYIQTEALEPAKEQATKYETRNEEISSVDQSICEALDKYVWDEKSFKNPAYTIHDLSKGIGIPVYKISPALNTCYSLKFNTWLNGFRIKEFEEMILNGAYGELNLDGISAQCGFSNRTTFTNSCKKITGETPGNYMKRISSPDKI